MTKHFNKKQRQNYAGRRGSIFAALFGAVVLVGVLAAGINTVMRGPVTTMSEVTRRTVAENNMIAATRLAIVMAPTTQANGGDCDGDGYVEPIPYRDAGGGTKPEGGGYIPPSIGAQTLDPWSSEYGYCVWDHGAQTVSHNVTACGGATAKRLNGAPAQSQIAVAIISAGKDRLFQTACNSFVDANFDNVADTPLLNKPGPSDDIILGYTYAEANGLGNNLWALKTADPDTAQIAKNIEVDGDATFTGRLNLMGGGLLLPGDPGNNTITGPCNTANDQVLRRNTSTTPPTIEICDHAGGATGWAPIAGGDDNLGDHTAEQALNMANFKIVNTAIPTASADVTNKAYVDAAVASGGGGGGRYQISCSNESGSNYAFCIMVDTQTGITACQYRGSTLWSSGSWAACSHSPDFTNLAATSGTGPSVAANAFAWGRDNYGALGNGGSASHSNTPVKIDLNLAFTAISGEYDYACGIASAKPYCWGAGSYHGAIGNGYSGSSTDYASPTSVDISSIGFPIVDRIGTANILGYMRTNTGVWYSWGLLYTSSSPSLSFSANSTPQLIHWLNTSGSSVPLPNNFDKIVVSWQHACALRATGALHCSSNSGGSDNECYTGTGAGDSSCSQPGILGSFRETNPVHGGFVFTDVAAGYHHTCGITGGAIRCWGYAGSSYGDILGANRNGGLITPWDRPLLTSTSHITPAPVFNKIYSHMRAFHTCALTDAGKAYCWGYNDSGQLGVGDTLNRNRPEPVLGTYNFASLAVGQDFTCGVTTDGNAYCWGNGGYGQLGHGGTSNKLIPEPVSSGSGYIGIAAGARTTYGWK